MKHLASSFAAVLLIVFAAATYAATAQTTLHIEGMTCKGCETAVKLALKKTPGVTGSEVSYEKKQAVVALDPAKTTPAKIAAAVADALGYKVTVVNPAPAKGGA